MRRDSHSRRIEHPNDRRGILYDMCMQCAMGAMTAGAAATGTRAWLAAHTPEWAATPIARRAGKVLFVGSFVLAGGVLGGTAH